MISKLSATARMTTKKEDWEFRIAKLQLEEGDILVVKTDCPVRHDVLEHIIPRGVKILYVPNDLELSVLTKAEIEAKAA
jgi:carbamoylphosphate synthase small subunit